MLDVLVVVLTLLYVAVNAAFAAGCERLMGRKAQ